MKNIVAEMTSVPDLCLHLIHTTAKLQSHITKEKKSFNMSIFSTTSQVTAVVIILEI